MSLPTVRFGKNFSLCQMDCKSFSQCANKSTKRGLTQFERLGLLEGTAHLTAYLPGQRWKGGSQMTPCWRERCANLKKKTKKVQSASLEWWFSNFSLHQNHVDGVLKHISNSTGLGLGPLVHIYAAFPCGASAGGPGSTF